MYYTPKAIALENVLHHFLALDGKHFIKSLFYVKYMEINSWKNIVRIIPGNISRKI